MAAAIKAHDWPTIPRNAEAACPRVLARARPMRYIIAFIAAFPAFITTFVGAILLFGEIVPAAFTQWMKTQIWGREIGGLIRFVIALAAAVGVFWLLS